MTALEFIKDKHPINTEGSYVLRNVEELMIDFAQFHAKTQLEAILNNVKTKESWWGNPNGFFYTDIDRDSIKNAYPLTNIK